MTEVQPAAVADEGRHPTDSTDPWWSESIYLDFFDVERGIGGYVRLGILPNQGHAWYWACVVGPDRPLVTVIDHEVPLPAADRWEIRHEGLWADYTVETALEHVSVGLEAFAVAVDDPAEVYHGELRGERVPLGFELEWETDGTTSYAYPGVDRYEVPARVHGKVLVGDEEFEIDGWGQRDHSWGNRDWWGMSWSWTSGRFDDGTRFHGTGVQIGGADVYTTGYVQDPAAVMVGTDVARHGAELDAEGLVTAGRWQIGDLELEVTPVAWSPVLVDDGAGRLSRFPRAWTTFRAADGRTGHGWTEWNQPQ